ncbi:MAG: hypothetical protein P4L79_09900 [Legionella sp.]|uniref:hypothetical protein n=1 Tax=Legionella sp. TaxID=459 RepID=UPI0028445D7C|nr:hypothetical protein [Legionella sp.]
MTKSIYTRQAAPTYWVNIFMAGPIDLAKQICRKHCFDVGLCVTIDPTTYIYTGGEEEGFVVGLINYPRFPSTTPLMDETATKLADLLCEKLFQNSYTIMNPYNTVVISRKDH